MTLQLLIDAKDGQEPSLIYALHTHTNGQKIALNATLNEYERKLGYPVTRVSVSGGEVTVKKPGEDEAV